MKKNRTAEGRSHEFGLGAGCLDKVSVRRRPVPTSDTNPQPPRGAAFQDAVEVSFLGIVGVRASGAPVVAVYALTSGELFEFGALVGVTPLLPPVASGVVEIIFHGLVPVVVAVGIVGLDIGEIEEPPIVVKTVLADVFIVVVHRVWGHVFPLAFSVAGHEDKGHVGIL